jgi:hypothetical protein
MKTTFTSLALVPLAVWLGFSVNPAFAKKPVQRIAASVSCPAPATAELLAKHLLAKNFSRVTCTLLPVGAGIIDVSDQEAGVPNGKCWTPEDLMTTAHANYTVTIRDKSDSPGYKLLDPDEIFAFIPQLSFRVGWTANFTSQVYFQQAAVSPPDARKKEKATLIARGMAMKLLEEVSSECSQIDWTAQRAEFSAAAAQAEAIAKAARAAEQEALAQEMDRSRAARDACESATRERAREAVPQCTFDIGVALTCIRQFLPYGCPEPGDAELANMIR